MPKISVIIPVYKVEQFIERCAISLFEQTLDDIEYLFIDDCSPDNSVEIIKNVFSAPETYAVVLKETMKPVGSIGLMIGSASDKGIPDTEGEIGYWI
mgnify:CR=1 FL=1